jgi:hypothetical protein
MSIGVAKKLPDGLNVILTGEIVTLWPRDWNYLYVEESDRHAGIRVILATYFSSRDSSWDPIGDEVSVDGIMGTTAAGERYIAAGGVIRTGGPQPVGPVGQSTRSVQEDTLSVGLLVRSAGTVEGIDKDPNSGDVTSFTISDGYTKNGVAVATRVVVPGDVTGDPLGGLTVGMFVTVTGVVSLAEVEIPANAIPTGVRVILLRDLKIN